MIEESATHPEEFLKQIESICITLGWTIDEAIRNFKNQYHFKDQKEKIDDMMCLIIFLTAKIIKKHCKL